MVGLWWLDCAVHGETSDGKKHGGDFEDFGADGDGALAETVGEIAAGHREDNEREGEERADDQNFVFFIGGGEIGADDKEDDEVFEGVVVEGALELRDDEAPEAAAPGSGRMGLAGGEIGLVFHG